MLFKKNYHLGVLGVKFLLMSAFLIIRLPDDVIVTSRDVIMSDVGFFGLESFLSSLPDY